MIRLKLGRPVIALFLSALLLSASALPASATSTSGQLQEVGWAETVSSFLMASGIYPFESDPETGYEEWSVSSLKALWDEFRDDTTQVAYDIVDLTGNLVKGVIAIASGRWSVLRDFATWIVNKYNVTDNQTGVELGVTSFAMPSLPIAQSPSDDWVANNGLLVGGANNWSFSVSSSVSAFAFLVYYPQYSCYYLQVISLSSGVISLVSHTSAYPGEYQRHNYPLTLYSNNPVPFYLGKEAGYWQSSPSIYNISSAVPVYSTLQDGIDAFLGDDFSSFSGVTADTTTVSIPAALPEGTDFGGLAVSGTGVALTPEQLEGIVQNAVKEALKPSVAVVPVALSPDVNVSPSGEITLSGDVVIGAVNIPLQSSDYSAPNLSRVFPFSIPWDVLTVLDVLDAEPVRPEFNVDLYIPVLDVHVPWTIGVPEALQEPVDSFMASMRLLLLVAMCAGTLWLFWRSNL